MSQTESVPEVFLFFHDVMVPTNNSGFDADIGLIGGKMQDSSHRIEGYQVHIFDTKCLPKGWSMVYIPHPRFVFDEQFMVAQPMLCKNYRMEHALMITDAKRRARGFFIKERSWDAYYYIPNPRYIMKCGEQDGSIILYDQHTHKALLETTVKIPTRKSTIGKFWVDRDYPRGTAAEFVIWAVTSRCPHFFSIYYDRDNKPIQREVKALFEEYKEYPRAF